MTRTSSMSTIRILYAGPGEAQSDTNRQLSHAGADEPLTEHGQAQVEQLARALAALNISLHSEVLSSPLKRAQETATILANQLGLTVVPDERLREINVGELDGRSDEEAWRLYTEIVHRRWAAGEWSRRFPGGEHLRGLAQRTRASLLHAVRPEVGSVKTDVLVVGHGSGLRAALPYLIKNVEAAYPHTDLGPCSLTCFTAGPASRPAVLKLLAWDTQPADLAQLAADENTQSWERF